MVFMEHLEFLKPSLQKRQKRRDKRLGEELIECYRYGGGYYFKRGYKNKVRKNNYENAKRVEGMKKMHSGGTKVFNDNLQPLMRFLNTNQGKNWNKLYKVLCSNLDRRTLSGEHVFNHLWDFVYTNVTIENKRIYCMRYGVIQELTSSEKWPRFYVHPQTGQLMKARQLRKNK